jgi:hypothetical protein
MLPAPSRHEGRGQRGVDKVERDRVIDDSAQAGWKHQPSLGAAILI